MKIENLIVIVVFYKDYLKGVYKIKNFNTFVQKIESMS